MSDQWFYALGGSQQSGPVDLAKLGELARTGVLRPNDLVWREGMPDWSAASTVQGLFAPAAPAHVPPPPPPPPASPHASAQPLPYANLHAPAPQMHDQAYGRALGYADDARTAMILAIISVFCVGFVLGPVSLVLGYSARRKMRQSGNLDGEGMAVAAITIGWIVCGLHVLGVLLFMLAIAANM